MFISLTLNTYGLRSINTKTFNPSGDRNAEDNCKENIPISTRDLVNTFLRINNLTFNILGYIPVVKHVSGCVRMVIGGSIVLLTLAVGSPSAERGTIVGRWYKEALLTGVAQVSRGAIEAFVPFSSLINLSLDGAGTVYNLGVEISKGRSDEGLEDFEIEKRDQRHRLEPPYYDQKYPALLSFLYWA